MRIVSENSPEDLRRNTAQRAVDVALRSLAANLLRVLRGAGRPWELGAQAQAIVEAMTAYKDAVGSFPPSEALAVAFPIAISNEVMGRISAASRAEVRAEQDIIHGAMQIAASRLLGQRTQESTGHTEMMRGVLALEDARVEQRRRWAQKRPATKTTKLAEKKKTKVKAPRPVP